MAVVLAKCSDYWKAMIPPMKRKNNSAIVEKLQDTVYSWELASRMMFSAAHDPEGTKSYEAWKEMAGEYVEAGRMHMAFLLEEANSKEDNEAADKVMAECADIRDVQVDNIREQLTPEQLIEAEHLYENWKPGRCERDLTRLISEDYAWILYKEIETYCPNADLGHANAQTYVGDLHYLGAYGLKKNHIQAYAWYSLAATNGNLYASEQLDKLTNELSTQQLSEALIRIDEWKPGQCERDLMEAFSGENE